jgi:hypothetical protein
VTFFLLSCRTKTRTRKKKKKKKKRLGFPGVDGS